MALPLVLNGAEADISPKHQQYLVIMRLDSAFYRRPGTEAEIPELGSYRTTTFGERFVIVVRSAEDEIAVLESRCQHREVEIPFTAETQGGAYR